MYLYASATFAFFILFLLYFELFYLYLSFGGAIIGTFFFLDGHQIIANTVVSNYRKWRRLNNLVSSQYNNVFTIFWYSFMLINKAFYLSFLQYMNSSIKKVGRNSYEISYLIEGKMYKMIVKPQKGPSRVLQVSDENKEDITELVLPFLGPKNDWHGRKFVSWDFNRKSLTFELGNGEERTFKDEDILDVS